MYSDTRVLVVGTTSDYIDWIRSRYPERALFLTDSLIRIGAKEPVPSPHEEVVCNLADEHETFKTLVDHLQKKDISLNGIASFDCESMESAAVLAEEFSLAHPSLNAIKNCRDKYLSKILWRNRGITCPRFKRIASASDAVGFLKEIDGPCVLKPVSGSGSELIFFCKTAEACKSSFQIISDGLKKRCTNRLYRSFSTDGPSIIAEEFVDGVEFSSDFIIENEQIKLIRLCRKIPDKISPFGTIQGYVLPSSLPNGIDLSALAQILYDGAKALGLTRAICMSDFLISGNGIFLLEITPRPGGDCLPFLVRKRYNLDILKLYLDFVQQRPVKFNTSDHAHPYIGLRMHAKHSGILKRIDISQLQQNPRIHEIHLSRPTGHEIRMPPEDYDSWLLGHIIFEPFEDMDPAIQCTEILNQIIVEME